MRTFTLIIDGQDVQITTYVPGEPLDIVLQVDPKNLTNSDVA